MKALLFLLVKVLLLLNLAYAQFEDVPDGHWAEAAVLRMTELGVIMGFPDGRYHGDDYLTRYQTAVLLSRLWDSWSKEQLSDLWSELLGVSSRVDRMEMTFEQANTVISELQQHIEGRGDVAGLELRLQALETLLSQAEGGFVDALTLNDFERSYAQMLQSLEEELVSLELQMGDAQPLDVEEKITQLSLDIERLGLDVEALQKPVVNDYASQSRVSLLDARIKQLEEEIVNLNTSLQDPHPIESVPQPTSVFSLTVSSGLLGRDWTGGFGVGATSEVGDLNASLSESGLQARARGFITPGLALQARLDTRSGLGMVGLETSLGGLEFGLLAGVDDGLAGTFYARHDRNSLIPGLEVLASASLGDDERFALQLQGTYMFQGQGFGIGPSMAYHSNQPTSHLAPGLEAYVELGSASLSLSADYVFESSVVNKKDRYRNFPQGELRLSFDSGAFVNMSLDGGGPDFRSLPDFREYPAHDLYLGVKVGYTFRVD